MVTWVRSRYTCDPQPHRFAAAVGVRHWTLGVHWESWGVRVMLGPWHGCLRPPAWVAILKGGR